MGPAKKTTKSAKGGKTASPYNAFFQRELKKVKQENPEMSHKDAFKQAGLNWRTSSENPKNQSKGAVAGSSSDANAVPAEPLAVKLVEKAVEAAPAKQSSIVESMPTPPPPTVAPSDNTAPISSAAPVAAAAPTTAPASVEAQPFSVPLLSNNAAFGMPATFEEPKAAAAATTLSAFGKGGIPRESGSSSLEARASSPATSSAPRAPAARALTPVIPSMATHTVPGALTAAK
ncbi:hypothetical protein GGI20_004724 [Coemansia sp. BCRC 34301]|nr:hypothetical protein GGI20_004724 [Coemansia sp. BCRC 34301]